MFCRRGEGGKGGVLACPTRVPAAWSLSPLFNMNRCRTCKRVGVLQMAFKGYRGQLFIAVIAPSKSLARPAEFTLRFNDEPILAPVSRQAMESCCNCEGMI